MELYEYAVQAQPSLTLPWDEILLMPIGDIQHGAQNVDIPKLKRHIQWGMEHNAYFTGLGDYIDVASPSGRQKFQAARFYDSVEGGVDHHVIGLLDDLKRALEPSQGRWLALNKGHHFWEFSKSAPKDYARNDTDTLLAEFLGCPVTDEMGISITQLKFKDQPRRQAITAQIWQWHGEGSGQTMAAPLNKLEKAMARWQTVDVFLMGHYSRKVGLPIDCPVPTFGRYPSLRDRRRILACTGGFMRGYGVGTASYVEKAGLNPTNVGGVLVKIRPVHEEHGNRLDMNVEA